MQRRSIRLTSADQARLKAITQRCPVQLNASAAILAALAHYGSNTPTAEQSELFLGVLRLEDDLPSIRSTISLLPAEDAEVDDLLRSAHLPRRFSFAALVRLALVMFSEATDAQIFTAAMMLRRR